MLAEAVVFGSNELVGQYYLWGNYIDEALLKVDTHGTVAAADDDDHYYLHDHLYSTVAVLDAGGNVEERYEYDAYGKATIYDADYSQVRSETAIGNDYLFTGRRLDPESGIYYYRNRYYSPTLGRFLQNDPLGYIDGMNMYEYVRNNPSIYVDPLGECSSLFRIDALIGSGATAEEIALVTGKSIEAVLIYLAAKEFAKLVEKEWRIVKVNAKPKCPNPKDKCALAKEMLKQIEKSLESHNNSIKKHKTKKKQFLDDPYNYPKNKFKQIPKNEHKKYIKKVLDQWDGTIKKREKNINIKKEVLGRIKKEISKYCK